MLALRVRGLDDAAKVSWTKLISQIRFWLGIGNGLDMFMMHLQVFAFRKCTHMISLHIATMITRGLMTRLTWPLNCFIVKAYVLRYASETLRFEACNAFRDSLLLIPLLFWQGKIPKAHALHQYRPNALGFGQDQLH